MEIVGLKQIFENEIKNNRMQKKENKNIMNIFLGNIKDTKAEIIQKREFPKRPIVVGLIFSNLPDEINKKIFYYLGYKSRLSKMMEYPIRNIPICLRNKQERIISYVCRLYCNTLDINTEEPRREDFLKLPHWVRQSIDAYLGDKSLRKQMIGLGVGQYSSLWLKDPRLARRMEEEAEDKRRDLTKQLQLSQAYYNYFHKHYINEVRLMKESINDSSDECDFID
jgi:hypothetical protein